MTAMSKIFNDDWMASYGFLKEVGQRTVGEVLHAKSGDMRIWPAGMCRLTSSTAAFFWPG